MESCSNQQKHSSIEIQIQEELEKYPLNSELDSDNVTDAEKHRRHMRNFFDSVSKCFMNSLSPYRSNDLCQTSKQNDTHSFFVLCFILS